MMWRLIMSCLEVFLLGLDLRLIVYSCKQRHADAVLAEVSYLMFVFYVAWVDFLNRHSSVVTPGVMLKVAASVIGIAGLIGIARHMSQGLAS
jgi:hypothetical protein